MANNNKGEENWHWIGSNGHLLFVLVGHKSHSKMSAALRAAARVGSGRSGAMKGEFGKAKHKERVGARGVTTQGLSIYRASSAQMLMELQNGPYSS
jgi:hypothetical protein